MASYVSFRTTRGSMDSRSPECEKATWRNSIKSGLIVSTAINTKQERSRLKASRIQASFLLSGTEKEFRLAPQSGSCLGDSNTKKQNGLNSVTSGASTSENC